MSHPLDRLRHHVSGAIERGEKDAIVEQLVKGNKTMNHTPTPLTVLEHHSGGHLDGYIIADANGIGVTKIWFTPTWGNQEAYELEKKRCLEQAQHIVHCVNTHAALVEALQELVEELAVLKEFGVLTDEHVIMNGPLRKAQEALRLAKEGV